MLLEEDRATATSNMPKNLVEIGMKFRRYAREQRDRQAHHNTPLLFRGRSNKMHIYFSSRVYRHSITKSKLELSSSDILIVLNNWHSPNRIETSLGDY